MNQKDFHKAPVILLNSALVFQIIYLVGTLWIAMDPEFFLQMADVGYEGGYAMPFDFLHLSVALGTTIIFGFMYTLLMIKIKKNEQVGLGFGIFLGVLSYLMYFLVTSGLTTLVNQRVEQIKKDDALVHTILSGGLGFQENMSAYALVLVFQELVELGLKTAIIFLMIAYGIYCYRMRKQSMPRRMY